ncbi:MAG: hypothetical protein Hyperionvirus1_145 [Hyperionvirus sp.]|uniref:Serine dehydrogenase proteinase n=1 Tax=Hyperionvirus sp. TaxID=2487770 RepID=A0A3G5A5P7_9VIRU|nr:MAG: hypothetical protein Hyperionvirus1_145 [Hyperionvirus sp.]
MAARESKGLTVLKSLAIGCCAGALVLAVPICIDRINLRVKNKITLRSKFNFQKWIKLFDKLNFTKDVIIEIQSFGGSVDIFVFLAKHIIKRKMKYKFRLICHIPEYACSGAWLIANCADSFEVNEHTFVSPFDPLMILGEKKKALYPIALTENKDAQEIWLKRGLHEANFKHHADIYRKKVGEILDMIATMHEWDEARKGRICDEFLSGKNSHCNLYSPTDLERFGYKINYIPK